MESGCQPSTTYRLNILTYGTGPASFLATRCLAQLSSENTTKFPETSEVIKRLLRRQSHNRRILDCRTPAKKDRNHKDFAVSIISVTKMENERY